MEKSISDMTMDDMGPAGPLYYRHMKGKTRHRLTHKIPNIRCEEGKKYVCQKKFVRTTINQFLLLKEKRTCITRLGIKTK
jgi:hypothetical protein